jgi:hypothetical protein
MHRALVEIVRYCLPLRSRVGLEPDFIVIVELRSSLGIRLALQPFVFDVIPPLGLTLLASQDVLAPARGERHLISSLLQLFDLFL